ncbi:MAG: [citrate (pro-3S)-lyase] ligase [Angelakisella sp.]
MREEYKISLKTAEPLIRSCGLSLSLGVDYTVGVFEEDVLVATGSLCHDMIQMLAVSEQHQGEDLAAVVITHLIGQARQRGYSGVHLFTKPGKVSMFSPLGFRQIAIAPPHAALLEWGSPGIADYCATLRRDAGEPKPVTAALVMNCNPFTLGHRYLVETAAANADKVVILVVEEDVSEFPFAHRIELVRQGTAHLPNVVVLSGGRYAVSSLTFPSYFTKEDNLAAAQSAIDADIFVRHTAPALGVTKRFVGTEPLSPTTAIYNAALLERLPPAGIEVVELMRREQHGAPVSASRVRKLLSEGRLPEVQELVPDTTWAYLNSDIAVPVLERLQRK